jgi:hypothetical protein
MKTFNTKTQGIASQKTPTVKISHLRQAIQRPARFVFLTTEITGRIVFRCNRLIEVELIRVKSNLVEKIGFEDLHQHYANSFFTFEIQNLYLPDFSIGISSI